MGEDVQRPDAGFSVCLLGCFLVVVAGDTVFVKEGQAMILVKRLALLRSVGIEQVLEWFWPGENPTVGKRRLRNLLNRVNQQTGGLLVRCNGQLTLSSIFVSDATAVKGDIAVLETAILGSTRPRTNRAELDEIERRLLGIRSTICQILPDDRYDDVVDEARQDLSRRVLVLERALSLLRCP
jgi:DNA-binding SARP family transcriptional activator